MTDNELIQLVWEQEPAEVPSALLVQLRDRARSSQAVRAAVSQRVLMEQSLTELAAPAPLAAAAVIAAAQQALAAGTSASGSVASLFGWKTLLAVFVAVSLPLAIWKMQQAGGPIAPVNVAPAAIVPQEPDPPALEPPDDTVEAPAVAGALLEQEPVVAPAVDRTARPAEPPVDAPDVEPESPSDRVPPGFSR